MPQKNRPEADLSPADNAPAPEAKKKKGYVKYSPLSLILLAVCAFVFSFSLWGLFEQMILDAAGSGGLPIGSDEIFGPSDDGGDGDLVPPGPNTPSTVSKWEKIAATDIDISSLKYLQEVGFETLLEQNEDTVAWMYWPTTTDVKGLPFNMPVVQTENNEFYLNRSFDKTSSANGWIYADYRCDLANLTSNRNTIIYGHARSYLMFGGLRYLNTKSKWQQDARNHFIYINTPTERTVWQVFAWYETTTAFNYINTYFSSDTEFVEFLKTLQAQNTISAFESFQFTPQDRILTLSTCKGSNSDVRIAIHAVLVKSERLDGSGTVTDRPDGSATTDSSSAGNVPGGPTDGGTPSDGGSNAPTSSATSSAGNTSGGSSNVGTPSDGGSDAPASTDAPTGGSTSDSSTDSDTPPDTGASSGGTEASVSTEASSDGSSDTGTPSDTGSDAPASTDASATDGADGGSTDSGTPSDVSAP